jgi:hypothetical protein
MPSTIAEPGQGIGYRTRDADPLFAIIWLENTLGPGDGREKEIMKTFAAAVAILALIAMPVHAQMGGGGGGKRQRGGDQKTEQKKPQVDDKAYKAALERIPEPKEKYDPWGVARPAEPAKKPK